MSEDLKDKIVKRLYKFVYKKEPIYNAETIDVLEDMENEVIHTINSTVSVAQAVELIENLCETHSVEDFNGSFQNDLIDLAIKSFTNIYCVEKSFISYDLEYAFRKECFIWSHKLGENLLPRCATKLSNYRTEMFEIACDFYKKMREGNTPEESALLERLFYDKATDLMDNFNRIVDEIEKKHYPCKSAILVWLNELKYQMVLDYKLIASGFNYNKINAVYSDAFETWLYASFLVINDWSD